MNLSTCHIPPEGSLNSSVAIVGEAGGEEEDRLHRPFVGKTGKEVFDPCLSSAGFIRSKVYITNLIKEHPPKNDLTKFITLGKKNIIKTQEYLEYEQLLKEELNNFTGNLIIAMGNAALYALTGYQDVTKRRGSIYPCTLTGHGKVLACIHPAAALRQYTVRHLIVRDLKIAKEECEYPEIRTTERTLRVQPSVEELLLYLEAIKKQGICGFDIENTMNDQPTHIGFALSPTDALSFPLVWNRTSYLNPEQELEVIRAIGEILEDSSIIKVGQNLTHDATIMWYRYGIVTRNIEDTMIAATIINPDLSKGSDLPGRRGKKKRPFPVGLAFLTSWYTRENYYKDEGKRWKDGTFNDEEHSRYNAKDCAVCMEIWPKQKKELERMNNWDTYERQRDSFYPLLYASVRGRKVDSKGIENVGNESQRIVEEKRAEFSKLCGREINTASTKQLMNYFYVEKGIKPYINRKTHRPTLDEIALHRLAARGIPEANLLLDIRELDKLISTYYKVRIGEDGRLRTSYNPAGTETGRSSSTAFIGSDEGTNLQNQPPSMKRIFIADPDCILVEIDKAQAENRIVAYVSGDPAMMKAFEEGIDVHRFTAGSIYNKPWKEISDEKYSSKFSGGTLSERDDGKRANHSLNYGFSAESFALKYRMPIKNARSIREGYFRLYRNVPGVFWKYVESELRTKRSLTNCLGRTRIFLDRMGDDLFRVGYAFIPQSTVADILHLAKQWYWKKAETVGTYGEILGETHDSLTLQFPLSALRSGFMAEEMLQLKKVLEPELHWKDRKWIIPTDFKAGFSLGAWKKDFTVGIRGIKWGEDADELTRNLIDAVNKLGKPVEL